MCRCRPYPLPITHARTSGSGRCTSGTRARTRIKPAPHRTAPRTRVAAPGHARVLSHQRRGVSQEQLRPPARQNHAVGPLAVPPRVKGAQPRVQLRAGRGGASRGVWGWGLQWHRAVASGSRSACSCAAVSAAPAPCCTPRAVARTCSPSPRGRTAAWAAGRHRHRRRRPLLLHRCLPPPPRQGSRGHRTAHGRDCPAQRATAPAGQERGAGVSHSAQRACLCTSPPAGRQAPAGPSGDRPAGTTRRIEDRMGW